MYTDNSDLFIVWLSSALMIYGAIWLIDIIFGWMISHMLLGICEAGGYCVCIITETIFHISIAAMAIGVTRIYYKRTRTADIQSA